MEQSRQKRDISHIFYGVIGVATLMVAIMGATFAYFTATAGANNALNGNMATISFDVTVKKVTTVDESKGGLIPMSNNMMEQALTATNICVDNNGNAVCQVYKITVVNTSTSSMFVDGYLTLTGGSGTPADYTAVTSNATTMRWAQAFCSTEDANGRVTSCTTAGDSTVRSTNTITMTALGGESTKANGLNTAEIKYARTDVTYASTDTNAAVIQGNSYEVIKQNYIRVSDHVYGNTTYTRVESTTVRDITSALVYNQYLEANDNTASNNTGTSSSTFKDAQVYYVVVWLSENGHNQTATESNPATNFYRGSVTFITAQGSEVTATFAGHTRVTPNT